MKLGIVIVAAKTTWNGHLDVSLTVTFDLSIHIHMYRYIHIRWLLQYIRYQYGDIIPTSMAMAVVIC